MVVRNLVDGGVPLKTAVAMAITGVTWTLLGVYARQIAGAALGTYLGWLALLAGMALGYWHEVTAPHWYFLVLAMGVALQAGYLFYRVLKSICPWSYDLLAEPTKRILEVGSVFVSVLSGAIIFNGANVAPLEPLLLFVALQLLWHGWVERKKIFGACFFLLSWTVLLALTAPGAQPLAERLSIQLSATPTLLMLLLVQLVYVLLEPVPVFQHKASALLVPAFFISSLAAMLLAIGSGFDLFFDQMLSSNQLSLMLLVMFLTARNQRSGPYVLLAFALSFECLLRDKLHAAASIERMDVLLSPWRVALFSFVLACAGKIGAYVCARQPRWLLGRYPLAFFWTPVLPFVYLPAVALAVFAGLYQSFHPGLRALEIQLLAPYLSAATLVLVGESWSRPSLFFAGSFFLTLGNIHLVRFYAGDFLRSKGVMENHLICLGFALTLLQSSILRRLIRRPSVTVFLNRFSLALAGLILVFLSVTYFANPMLSSMTNARFMVSGIMALMAGWYFHRAARHPDAGEEAYVDICEGLYHFGVSIAIWCAALLIPWMRTPNTSFLALGLPVFYFYLRAEMGSASNPSLAVRYRNSSAFLSFVMLGFYAFRAAFQWVVFPDLPILTAHYHFNAPFIMLLGLVMFRLNGLGGTSWLAFYGGLSLMVGSYFSLTGLPTLSPFDFPIASAWCAIALGHFWTTASAQQSPLRTLIQRMGAIDDSLWSTLRRSWGLFLAVAIHISVLWAVTHYSLDTFMMAPLIAGVASVLIHQGLYRKSTAYFVVAGCEIILALHADFWVPSYLAKDHIIWSILGLWAAFELTQLFRSSPIDAKSTGIIATLFGAFVMGHVFYHHPDSTAGLWGVALAALLFAFTSRATAEPIIANDKLSAAILLFVPTWLVYFSQGASFEPWPVLATSTVLFLTGVACGLAAHRPSLTETTLDRLPRRFDQTFFWIKTSGSTLNTTTLWISVVAVSALQVHHYDTAWTRVEFGLIAGLYAAFSFAWFYEGRQRKNMMSYIMLELCLFAFFAVARRQLMLTTNLWTYEYDVWASLAASFIISGIKNAVNAQREARYPMVGTILALPAAAIAWVLIHHLGTDMALLVVGLHSMMFAYMGKDDSESPYNIVAVAGFVAFTLIIFANKLHLNVLNAYVIPVGLGILLLLHLFRNRISPFVKNQIRFATLLSMLGSTGYYALLDDRYTIVFNLTMIILSLIVMGMGSLLRVKMYIGLGLTALMADLGSLVYKVLSHMDHSTRMTLVGGQVLLVGTALVFGAIYYKTHQEDITAKMNTWRRRMNAWE